MAYISQVTFWHLYTTQATLISTRLIQMTSLLLIVFWPYSLKYRSGSHSHVLNRFPFRKKGTIGNLREKDLVNCSDILGTVFILGIETVWGTEVWVQARGSVRSRKLEKSTATLAILDNRIKEHPRSYALDRAESVLGTVFNWSLREKIAAHYFRDIELTSDLCSLCPRQHYLPLARKRWSMSSFLGKVSMKQRQGPLGLICEENFRALFPKRAGKNIIKY